MHDYEILIATISQEWNLGNGTEMAQSEPRHFKTHLSGWFPEFDPPLDAPGSVLFSVLWFGAVRHIYERIKVKKCFWKWEQNVSTTCRRTDWSREEAVILRKMRKLPLRCVPNWSVNFCNVKPFLFSENSSNPKNTTVCFSFRVCIQ